METQGNKIGNAHLKWAFGEIAVLHLVAAHHHQQDGLHLY